MTNPEAVAPKKSLIVVLATMLGGMVSVGYVSVTAALKRGVESPEQLEELGINVLRVGDDVANPARNER